MGGPTHTRGTMAANGFPSTVDMNVQSIWTKLRRYGRATTHDGVCKHGDDADEESLAVVYDEYLWLPQG